MRGELLSIDTAGDRTLFFDFLPMDLGTIGKFRIKISLYTVPGQVRYNDTRKLVLKGVDGIVFVADSLAARRTNNMESLQNLEENLRDMGKSMSDVPIVLQWNKRDLEGSRVAVLPVEELEAETQRQPEVRVLCCQRPAGSRCKGNLQEDLHDDRCRRECAPS